MGGSWLYYDSATAGESTELPSLPIRVEVLESFCKYDALSYYTSDYMSFFLIPSVLRHAARRESESLPLICGGQVDA